MFRVFHSRSTGFIERSVLGNGPDQWTGKPGARQFVNIAYVMERTGSSAVRDFFPHVQNRPCADGHGTERRGVVAVGGWTGEWGVGGDC